MRTFRIQTLGCKVNQYESEQMATLLRTHGLTEAARGEEADLRIVNTCSVTMQAAGKSRQTVRRRSTSLPVLSERAEHPTENVAGHHRPDAHARVVVTGCWATSDKAEAARLPGVSAVLGHHDDVAAELSRLVDHWILEDDACGTPREPRATNQDNAEHPAVERVSDKGWMKSRVPAEELTPEIKSTQTRNVKQKPPVIARQGAAALPMLTERQSAHQRAFLKIQDGCDAHCTYCIIPRLRPALWSKPVDDAVAEAQRLIDSGHAEIVLTGIFMGAYGQPTALRRRQPFDTARPLGELIGALCTRVIGLRRLRLSSLEPGDLTDELIGILNAHPQTVPHFHLPLQSGSDELLRRMNRQYTRDEFLRMIDRVNAAFDRPAITTDIIVGFPGESDTAFAQTLDVVERAKFIGIHAFSFSPRPGTAAARWTADFVRGPIVNERISLLNARADEHSHNFRRQFLGETVEILLERPRGSDTLRHGRCERYFEVYVDAPTAHPGDAIRATITHVDPHQTVAVAPASANNVIGLRRAT